ncbi:MAG: hypothetical protein AAGA30_10035, partial [Planctomycetota bacterium]
LGAVGATIEMLPIDLKWDDDNDPTNDLDTSQNDYITNQPAPAVLPMGVPTPYPAQTVNGVADGIEIDRLRRVESSSVDLPPGYIVDLRYSGPADDPIFGSQAMPMYFEEVQYGGANDLETRTLFGLGIPPTEDPASLDNREIQIHFDQTGVDQIVFNGTTLPIAQALYFMINEFDPNASLNAQLNADEVLSNPDNLWVTMERNGGVSIGYNTVVASADIGDMIFSARETATNRVSADQ